MTHNLFHSHSVTAGMADRSKIIEKNLIGKGLGSFRASFNSLCGDGRISCVPDALDQLAHKDLQNLALDLPSALQTLPASRSLRSEASRKPIFSDRLSLNSAIISDDFDLTRIKPLLATALADDPDDAHIWRQVGRTVTESTPPPRPIASSL
ncbi:hypothetical protein MKZ38_008116 [Zalerion maritima]|uniref:Uncharacterized protein n=1 Tax=Zalerion maritima TaxID=339359 RepID=A0AAD5RH13_9PEZI|nr:hypothetical protein MKZ38_008116 [Zalerion maritima]